MLSFGMPIARSAKPSELKSPEATTLPNRSPLSRAPFTPHRPWCHSWSRAVTPEADPYITCTAPTSSMPRRSSPGTPTARSAYPSPSKSNGIAATAAASATPTPTGDTSGATAPTSSNAAPTANSRLTTTPIPTSGPHPSGHPLRPTPHARPEGPGPIGAEVPVRPCGAGFGRARPAGQARSQWQHQARHRPLPGRRCRRIGVLSSDAVDESAFKDLIRAAVALNRS